MEVIHIQRNPRHFDYTLCRVLEIEQEIPTGPNADGVLMQCPNCGATMMYRGIGRLRSGTRVHHYECVHSHREVHSISIVVSD